MANCDETKSDVIYYCQRNINTNIKKYEYKIPVQI